MPEVDQAKAASEQAAVLEGVKSAEVQAKAKLQEAAAQAEKIKAAATLEGEHLVKEVEERASKLREEVVQAAHKDTEKEIERISAEAAESADKTRHQKEKKVDAEKVLRTVLDI